MLERPNDNEQNGNAGKHQDRAGCDQCRSCNGGEKICHLVSVMAGCASSGHHTLDIAIRTPIGSWDSMMVMSWLNRFKIDPASVFEKND